MQELELDSRERKHRNKRDHMMEIVPLDEMERQAIMRALVQLDGDKSEAARRLGIGKSTLYRKLKRYGVPQ